MQSKPDTKTVKALLNLRKSGMLIVNPEYQRGEVWNAGQQKKLIDSVLRGYPIPLIYLHYIKRTVEGFVQEGFEVIDGQQRINALYLYTEGRFKLFDPVKDETEARFPAFIKEQPCPWGGKAFEELSETISTQLMDTPLSVVMIDTPETNEARDLFIRLQSGMPLNSQEKRDAWPGQFTDFILKVGGKPQVARYPGHEFFPKVMKAKDRNRGEFRQLCAQMFMLFIIQRDTGGEKLCDINREAIDTFYYKHLNFDAASAEGKRFVKILDILTEHLNHSKMKKVIGHEAIHLVLLIDVLLDDYTLSWTGKLSLGFEAFRLKALMDKETRHEDAPGEFWLKYGQWTRTNSDRADTLERRHEFFTQKMYALLAPQMKDPTRLFGPLEKELIYYRDKKKCRVCGEDVKWTDAEYHHIDEHSKGGQTILDNGALVHGGECHPKGRVAVEEFAKKNRALSASNETGK